MRNDFSDALRRFDEIWDRVDRGRRPGPGACATRSGRRHHGRRVTVSRRGRCGARERLHARTST